MAVYTRISEQELTDYLAQFDCGTLLSFEGITEGVENTNYIVTTTAGKYILTLFEKRAESEDLPFFITFMGYLRENNLPVSAVAATREEHRVLLLKEKPAILSEFLEGKWLRTPQTNDVAETATLLARMHLLGRGFSLKRHNTLSLPAWVNLVHACGASADKFEAGLFDALAGELVFLKTSWPKYLPKGAVHADLFPDNVLFKDGKISGIIDFYFSCTDAFAYDLMLTFNAWCFDASGNLDKKKAEAFLDSYYRIRPLTKAELKNLPFFGRAAAIRIIATRLYDALNPAVDAIVKPKDPMEHVRILRFHQTSVFPADYRLAT